MPALECSAEELLTLHAAMVREVHAAGRTLTSQIESRMEPEYYDRSVKWASDAIDLLVRINDAEGKAEVKWRQGLIADLRENVERMQKRAARAREEWTASHTPTDT